MSFKDDIDDDLAKVFFNQEEFAEVVVYHPADGIPYEAAAIFDSSTDNQNPAGNGYAMVQSSYVRIRLREADVTEGVFKEDWVTVREVDYNISDKESDGHGVLTLILQEKL